MAVMLVFYMYLSPLCVAVWQTLALVGKTSMVACSRMAVTLTPAIQSMPEMMSDAQYNAGHYVTVTVEDAGLTLIE